ncbi:MAG TPA: chemotaxis protein CheA [Patescibacteria group bacterium]|nr:chemotaxis protein CheA [Patescibacteria group bacterium]
MTGNDMSREPMLEMFLFESTQMIEQLEEIIIRCEKSRSLEPRDVNEIFRIMHTVKGAAAMMMFNNISTLAHSLEDLFFFIREQKEMDIDFDLLSELSLAFADYTRNELAKIEAGQSTEVGPPEQMVAKNKDCLEQMKASCGAVAEVASAPKSKTMFYISKYETAPGKTLQRYQARIYFDEGCLMENVRAYTVINNLKDIGNDILFLPPDIIDNDETADTIRESGFFVTFTSGEEYADVEKNLSQTAFLHRLELEQLDETETAMVLPEAVTPEKRQISLEDIREVAKSGKTDDPEREEVGGMAAAGGARHQSVISVSIRKLDTLMDLVGEIVISEAMVTRNPGINGPQLEHFSKASRQLRKLTTELQDIVMSIRMVPVAMTFQKMNRLVRDMGKKLNKDVELEIIGETTEVDKNIIDNLSDPLMHLIRNSMDHGLETREEREAAGKPLKAKITLEARNVGGEVWIFVRDDGKGLKRDVILEKARCRGLVTKADSELTDKEIYACILLPGFSTKENVSEFSGRGVGMDVVKKNIEKIGGSILLESVPGQGTEILLKIPLTLAIINGIEIGVGQSRYTIPTTSITESFKVDDKDVIADADGNEIIMVRGQCYPVLRIQRMFNLRNGVNAIRDGIMVMIEYNGRAACLFADRLIGEQQVVVKALPTYLKKVKGLAGCTILGDGSISLILDINGLFNQIA